MSDLILPGDPPASFYKQQMAAMYQELMQTRQRVQGLLVTLSEVVSQLGIENVLVLGPPVPKEGSYYLSMAHQEDGGVKILLQPTSNTAGNHDGDQANGREPDCT